MVGEREGIANLSFAEYVLECLCVATVCVSNMQSVLIAAESDQWEYCATTLQWSNLGNILSRPGVERSVLSRPGVERFCIQFLNPGFKATQPGFYCASFLLLTACHRGMSGWQYFWMKPWVWGIIVKVSLTCASYLLRVYLLTTYEQETLVYAELFAYNNCPLHVWAFT